MSASARRVPPIVSKRNEFSPADEFVETHVQNLPDQFKHPDFRVWLLRYTETVIKGIASDFGIAASRGIEQAANLLCDPEFYETRRKRRAKRRRDMAESQAKQDWERIERDNCPTAEQIAEQVSWAERQIAYHQRQEIFYQQRLVELKAKSPKNIRIFPKSVQ